MQECVNPIQRVNNLDETVKTVTMTNGALRSLVREKLNDMTSDEGFVQNKLKPLVRAVRSKLQSNPVAWRSEVSRNIVTFGDHDTKIDVEVRATAKCEISVALRVNDGEWFVNWREADMHRAQNQRLQGRDIYNLTLEALTQMKLTRKKAEDYIDVLQLLFLYADTVSHKHPELRLSYIDDSQEAEVEMMEAA